MYFLVLFLSFISHCISQDSCKSDSQKYFSCITDQRKNPWAYRRPYQDVDGISRCLIDAGCDNQPNFSRGLFADFIPEWQHVGNKMWEEFVNTPETVKECVRQIIVKYTRRRLDQCVQSVGGTPLGNYPEDLELPYCGFQMRNQQEVNDMQAGLREKVDVLHELSVCKEKKGEGAAAKASECMDAIRHAYMVKNFCNTSNSCLKSSASSCTDSVKKNTVAICQCVRSFRDQAIAQVDRMYATKTIQIIKLIPSFLGLELTHEITAQMNKCFTDVGKEPISLLKFFDDPMLSGSMQQSINPSVSAVQTVRELLYSQMDVPDYCEICT